MTWPTEEAFGRLCASPWDALLRAPRQQRHELPADGAMKARSGTKLAGLLAELSSRTDATTLTLAVCSDLTSRQVWGLLKAPREYGQVRFEAGRWSLSRDFAGRDVERAAALLRDRGWRVEPPNVRANLPPQAVKLSEGLAGTPQMPACQGN